MCTIKLLKTKRRKAGELITRTEGEAMSYYQIQYYNDCIRAYASKIATPIDKAFDIIDKKNLLSIIETAYKENRKVYVAVNRMLNSCKA